jgi:hypothetical protein
VWGRVKMLFSCFVTACAVLLSLWYFLLRSIGAFGVVVLVLGIALGIGAIALAFAAMKALGSAASRPAGITPEELQEALKEHAAKSNRDKAARAELVNTLVTLANRGKSELADQLQAFLDEGVRIHETYSFVPIQIGASSDIDIREWTKSVEAALANRPRDLALFRLRRSEFMASFALGAERRTLAQKLTNLERIIPRVRAGQ